MKRALLLLVIAGCWSGLPPKKAARLPTRDFAEQLAAASQAGDATTIRNLLGPKVIDGGLWFSDADCTHEFAGAGDVGGGRLDELARCLATLKLQVSQRGDGLPDVAVLSYAPGFEVEARFIDRPDGPWLSWIGYAGRRDESDALPTLTPEAVEALRIAGERNPVVTGLEAEYLPKYGYAYAWLKVCVDGQGAVTRADVRVASSMHARHVFGEIPASWRFRPFMQGQQSIPFCVLERLVAPLGKAPPRELLPPVLATPHGEPLIDAFGLHRVDVNQFHVSQRIDAAMRSNGITQLWVSYMYCVGTNGVVNMVRTVRPSGMPAFDAEVEDATKKWQFEPVLDGDRAVAVCTQESFAHQSGPR